MARKRRELPAGLTDAALDALTATVQTPEQLEDVRRLPGFDQKVLSLYARGLTVRELPAHLEECYAECYAECYEECDAVPVSAEVITAGTDAVRQEVTARQPRPLEPVYIAVVFDARRVKMRDEGLVQHKAVYVALGILPGGGREILGCWIAQTEGAAFGQRVMTEWQGRGLQDIRIAMIDGLVGFPEAIHAGFPRTVVHQCVVHLVRQSLRYVTWTERRLVARALRAIDQAESEAAARTARAACEASPWHATYPHIAPIWHRHWEYLAPALAYPLAVRRLLYSTNALESLHMILRKALKIRGHFPSDEAAGKLLDLALRNAAVRLNPPQDWTIAMQHLALRFGDRVPAPQ